MQQMNAAFEFEQRSILKVTFMFPAVNPSTFNPLYYPFYFSLVSFLLLICPLHCSCQLSWAMESQVYSLK